MVAAKEEPTEPREPTRYPSSSDFFTSLDKRDTKTGKSIVNGSIVDDTNSIKFIKFTNSPEEGDALLKQLKGL